MSIRERLLEDEPRATLWKGLMRKFLVIAVFLVIASPAGADGEAGVFGADDSASKLVGSLLTGPHRKADLPPGISGHAFDRHSAGLVLPSKTAFDLICRVVNVPLPMPDLLAVSRPRTDREKADCAANGVTNYVEIPWVEGLVEGVSASNKVVSHYALCECRTRFRTTPPKTDGRGPGRGECCRSGRSLRDASRGLAERGSRRRLSQHEAGSSG